MLKGYITRGTTISGQPVNQGEFVEVDEDTFRLLQQYGDLIPADKAPVPPPVDDTKKKKG